MLYLIGTGLYSYENLTIEAIKAIEECDFIYIDYYTSKLGTDIEDLEKKINKKIIVADRELLEQSTEILDNAIKTNVALLVIGDPLAATTHNSFRLDALQKNIKVKIIHNASVFTAIANTGLELYKFGATCSISYPVDNVLPKAAYKIIEKNLKNNMHTLCLMDIKINQIDPKHYMKYLKTGEKIYMPDAFMTPLEAIKILEKIEKEEKNGLISEDTKIFSCSRLGCPDEKIISGTIKEMKKLIYEKPLYCLIIPSNEMHFIEEDFYNLFKKNKK